MKIVADSELGKVRVPGQRPESDSDEMQGQSKGHPTNENQLLSALLKASAASTTSSAPMDSNSHQQPAAQGSSSAPQIRSRITVVCAECKRLKLKCDRRTPCGSCTKRDTVARCIYSPAAAEKVDLHSLNNRLIQTEAYLTLLTQAQGKTLPPFQSSYPLSQVSISAAPFATAGTGRNKPPIMPPSSISMSIHDLMTIWLSYCQLDLNLSGETQTLQKLKLASDEDDSGYIKLEPSPVDMLCLSTPYSEEAIVVDECPQLTPSSSFPRTELPPHRIYYTTPLAPQLTNQSTPYTYPVTNQYPSHDGFQFQTPSYPAAFSQSVQQSRYAFPPSTHTPRSSSSPPPPTSYGSAFRDTPTITPMLLDCLPPPTTRIMLIQFARTAFPQLELWVPWGRLSELSGAGDNDKEKQRELEKQKKAELARAIFFNSRSEPTSPPTSALPQPPARLPLFACLCYILSLGALGKSTNSNNTNVDPAFLYALAGQAMGVWEEHQRSSSESEKEELEEDGQSGFNDDLDHVVGSLLQIIFLIHASVGKGRRGLEAAFSLIGKIVNTARVIGLSQDPDEDPNRRLKGGLKSSESGKEIRRMIWWEIMFYDTFVSDALTQTTIIPQTTYSTRMPACGSPTPVVPSSGSSSRRLQLGNMDDDDCDAAGLDADGESSDSDGVSWNRRAARMKSSNKRDNNADDTRNPRLKGAPGGHAQGGTKDELFFGVRCRLTHLVQSIKHQFAHPGCECCGRGYTLDQAYKLENDIRNWITDLPPLLKLDSSPSGVKSNDARNTMLAAELSIMANRLIISVYMPLLKPPYVSSSSSHASRSWSPASRATVDAAQGIVGAARVLHLLLRGSGKCSQMMTAVFYPLEKAVVDAVVICAYTGLNSTSKAQKGKGILEDVAIGLDILAALGDVGRGDLGKVVMALRRRLDTLGTDETESNDRGDDNLLKRKHDQLDNDDYQGQVEGGDGSEGNNDLDQSHAQDRSNRSELVQDPSPIPSTTHSPEGHRPPPQPFAQPRHQSPFRRDPPSSRLKGEKEKEKDKKHSKKGPNGYPAFGIRVRKEPPPFAKRTETTTNGTGSSETARAPPQIITSSLPRPQPQSHSQPPSLSMSQEQAYRSRSSSISQDPRLRDASQPMNYSLPFGSAAQEHMDPRIAQQGNFAANENHQRQQSEENQPFGSIGLFNSGQQQSHSEPFDHNRGFDQQNTFDNSDSFINTSSPYPNSSAPLSTASSPYTSTGSNGPPPTPSFNSGVALTPHHPSPPTFGQPQNSSPQTFYHIAGGYDGTFNRHPQPHQPAMAHGAPMDTSMSDQGLGPRSMAGMLPSPTYEKPQQTMYDVKPSVDMLSQMQYHSLGDQTHTQSHQQHAMSSMPPSTNAPHSWNPISTLQPHQPPDSQNEVQFWSGTMYYN